MEPRTLEHGDEVGATARELLADTPKRARPKTGRKDRKDALLRHLIEHGEFDAALLFSGGQYVFYDRVGKELRPKGVSAQTMMTAFIGEPVDSGWLPPGIVRWGSGAAGTFMLKYIPPGRHTLRFTSSDEGGREHREMAFPLPGLLFAGASHARDGGRGAVFYVWALAETEFSPTARLYHAPLPNVYPEGHICWGTDAVPKVSWKTFDGAWQLFTYSRFSRAMCSGKSVREQGDVLKLLESLAQTERYPVEDLVPFEHRHTTMSGRVHLIKTVDAATRALLLMEEVDAE